MKRTLLILAIAIGLAFCAIGIVALPYINRFFSVSSVRFVVPDGYRGLFCIRERSDGTETKYSEDGIILYEVPIDGLLDVLDASPLNLTTSDIAIAKSGRVFQELPWPAAPPFDARLGYSGVSTTSEKNYWFLIGTEKELFDFFNGHHKFVGGVIEDQIQIDRDGGKPQASP